MASQQSNFYDPRQAEWNGTSIDTWNPSDWKQWKPSAPKDEAAKIEREYLRIKCAIAQANTALSIDRVKVKLKLTTAKSIGLQGTFPCKPGDVGKNGSSNKQYTISLGFPASDAGVKTAVAKARELDLLLMTKQFQWIPELLGKQAQKITLPDDTAKPISKLIQEYEREFWKTHEKNRQGFRTWETHYLRHLKKLPQNVPLTQDVLEQALEKVPPHTSTRFYLAWQLKKFCDFCGVDGNKIIDSYTTPQPSPSIRKIPTDEDIIQGFGTIGTPLSPYASKDAIQPQQWQWVYGMLATYGLRPHELFAVDLEAFTAPSNILHLVTLNPSLTGGTKTGERTCGIPPLHPQWVELFDLKNVNPYSGGTLNNNTAKIHIRFRTTHLNFKPYDLRHAYALRGHRLRIPIKTMADYMGHTVQEHTKTYQRWINEDTNIEIYKEIVIQKATTQEAIKVRVDELEVENAVLKAEIKTLRELLVKHQLGKLLN